MNNTQTYTQIWYATKLNNHNPSIILFLLSLHVCEFDVRWYVEFRVFIQPCKCNFCNSEYPKHLLVIWMQLKYKYVGNVATDQAWEKIRSTCSFNDMHFSVIYGEGCEMCYFNIVKARQHAYFNSHLFWIFEQFQYGPFDFYLFHLGPVE